MILANAHPVAAALTVAAVPGYPRERFGMLVAKATYQLRAGRCELDPARSHPIYASDLETPLGILPRDDLPRSDPAFEVILLGQAHAPGGTACERMTVSLSVGEARRDLQVVGDRRWESHLLRRRPSAPTPFLTMPLTWQRAFGGSSRIEIDRESFVDVCDVRNPAGRGFDHAREAASLGRHLRCPKGYPHFSQERALANLEAGGAAVRSWDDAPVPSCWATMPMTSAMHGMRIPSEPGKPEAGPGLLHRAHPDWVLAQPPASGAQVTLAGASSDGRISFSLPNAQVAIDVTAGGRLISVTATPQMLVLLPEERAFYLVHRAFFTVPPPSGDDRAARLRLIDGVHAS